VRRAVKLFVIVVIIWITIELSLCDVCRPNRSRTRHFHQLFLRVKWTDYGELAIVHLDYHTHKPKSEKLNAVKCVVI